jgi:hypothetical protein
MANLFFPQLSSGAMAQYPIRKTRLARTIKNILPDGSMVLHADPNAARLVWQLSYVDLALVDLQAIQAHFNACAGPFHAFTFIDPTENMLVSSTDLTAAVWQSSSLITLTPGMGDPEGGIAAFQATNRGQADQEISQTLQVPANFQYCLSVYAISEEGSTLKLIRRGSFVEESSSFSIGPSWTRVVSTGRLNDPGTTFSVAISVAVGQQIELYGIQLEAQLAPSRYRPTFQSGGVYPTAHWGVDELAVTSEAPNLFSTSFTVEAPI